MGSITMWHGEQLGSFLCCSMRSRMVAAEMGTFVAAAHTGLVVVHQAQCPGRGRGPRLRVENRNPGLIFRVFALLAIPCRRAARRRVRRSWSAKPPRFWLKFAVAGFDEGFRAPVSTFDKWMVRLVREY